LIEEKETEVIIDTEAKEISSTPIEVINDEVIDTYDSWEEALDDW
jgi:hypothetical protein